MVESLKKTGHPADSAASLFLSESADDWLKKYKPGTLRAKRLQLYTGMEGAVTL